jgi:hypothetical protein
LAIRHRLPATRPAAGRAENQAEITADQHGERLSRMHHLLEPEVPTVEGNRSIHVVNDVTDTDGGHRGAP